MLKFGYLPFKWKLTLIIMLACLVTLLTACAAFVGYEMYIFRNTVVQELNGQTEIISANSKQAVASNDKRLVQQQLASLKGENLVIAAAIYSKDGEVLGKYVKAGANEVVPLKPLKQSYNFEGNYVVLSRRITYNDDWIGSVYLKADLGERWRDRFDDYYSLGSIVMLVSCLVAFVVSFRLQPVISKPIINLVQTAKAVSEKKDFSVRAVKYNNDEIGELIDAFNQMLADIQARDAELQSEKRKTDAANEKLRKSHESLAEYNRTLEAKVQLRTAELARAVSEAQDARTAAEDANRAKSAFLANMSHELRTPLNAIIGYSEMLMEDAKDMGQEDSIEDLEKIHGAGKHLLGLINDVLDLTKIEAGKMDLYLETFDVLNMMCEVSSTIAPLVEKNGNKLDLQCADDIGNMHADATKVRQGLFNLLSNASKFTEKGTITLVVSRETVEGIPCIMFKVSDTGIGMTPEQMKKLFQPFTQADASTTRKFGGTGLGLTITRRFCQMMGGDAIVESEQGKGSTFTLRVPAHVSPPKTDKVHVIVKEAPALPAFTLPANAVRVLVVDDDPNVHDLMRRFLTKEGFQVETASGGKEGLRLAKELKPDAITLDVLMPDMDGWAVLSALKADPEVADIPVVMLSMIEDKQMGFALGASDYMTKPFNRDRLVGILKKFGHGDHPREVLVVEDDNALRLMVRRMLEKESWTVLEAENGRQALEVVAKTPPALILLDLTMPVMDGFQFLKEFRENLEWRKIPVIVMTARDISADEYAELSGRVEGILRKGMYSIEELLGEVRDLVSISARQAVVKA